MAQEENQEVEVKVDLEQEDVAAENTQPQYTDEEIRAMEYGWKPKEEWDGEPEDWVPARQFNQRGELFARISKLQNENKSINDAVKKLVDHNKKLFDAGYRRAMADLKSEKRTALEEGDSVRAMEIDERMEELKETHQSTVSEFEKDISSSSGPVNDPRFVQWAANNSWYGSNIRMQAYADGVAKEIVSAAQSRGQQIDYPKLLNEVSKEVRDKFPEYFSRRKESGVMGGSQTRTSREARPAGGKGWESIPAEHREMGMTFVKQGLMTKEEYAKQYFQIEGS